MLLSLASALALFTNSCFAAEPCPPPVAGTPEISDLAKLGFDLRQAAALPEAACHRLEEGASAVIDWNAGLSPTRVRHTYRLTRSGPKAYRSEVRLDFAPAPGEEITPKELTDFRVKIQRCLSDQAPLMKGPGGETLAISLSDDAAVPPRRILVSTKATRENDGLYSLKSTCPTFIHEIFHLHGLVDEYKEESIGIRINPQTGAFEYPEGAKEDIAFDCRHLGKPDSIMRNEWRAVVGARDWDHLDYTVCAPGAGPGDAGAEGCPAGKHGVKRYQNVFQGERVIDPYLAEGEELSPLPPQKTSTLPKTHASILEPAQFLAITRPGCRAENKTYYACSANAYVSSAEFKVLAKHVEKGSMMFGGAGAYDQAKVPTGGTMGDLGGMMGGGMGPPPAGTPTWAFGNTACQDTPPECKDPELWSSGDAH